MRNSLSTATAFGESRYLIETEDQFQVLRDLRDQRVPVFLRFDDDDATYQTSVLEIDAQKHEFILDVISREGHLKISAKRAFTLSCRAHGVYVYITDMQIQGIQADAGLPYYILAFPKRMLYQQRRRAFRAPISHDVGATGSLVSFSRDLPVMGRILDISAGGCRTEFVGAIDPPLRSEEQFNNCDFQLPGELAFRCSAVVRHAEYIPERDVTVCGLQFGPMEVRERRSLERLIQKLEKNI